MYNHRNIFDHRALLGGILYFEDWTGLDWTGLVKRGQVKQFYPIYKRGKKSKKKKNKDVRRSVS